MTFTNALGNALSGMNAATMAIQVRAGNIANATTEGYARRDVALDTGPLGGVRVTSILRSQDVLLQADRLSADARNADAQRRAGAMDAINTAFGEPGVADGLFASLSRFDSSLRDLANSPESGAYQQGAVDSAKDLSLTFNRLSGKATDLRTEADRDIASTVESVNSALSALDQLNRVGSRGAANGMSNLPEQRQVHIETIAAALDITISRGRGDQVRITTADGVVLLDETARQLEFSRGGIVAPGTRIENGQLSGLSVDGIDITPDATPQSIRTGGLAGLFAVRDEIGVGFEEQLDLLAEDFVNRFSDASVDPTLNVGDEGLFVSNGTGAGIAARLSVNQAVDPGEGGELWRIRDGINAAAVGTSAGEGVTRGLLSALSSQRTLSAVTLDPSALSAVETVAAYSSVIGTNKVQANSTAAASAATAQSLRDEELAVNGVNTDQELQSLLLIEQAYAANARVVQVVDEMLARLMEI